jgi:hypothetical protein
MQLGSKTSRPRRYLQNAAYIRTEKKCEPESTCHPPPSVTGSALVEIRVYVGGQNPWEASIREPLDLEYIFDVPSTVFRSCRRSHQPLKR